MRILIIAGHGGNDPGAVGKIKEARVNLNVALKLEELLIAKGHQVVMYRRTHEEPNGLNGNQIINDIINFIKKNKGDLIIHIHHNAGGGYGAECCVQVTNNVKSKSVALANKILAEFKKTGQTIHGSGIVSKWNSSKTGNYFGVLRVAESLGIPSVITEFGYVDSKDVEDFDTFTEQWKEAEAIANAI
jgi:N-acetylmuramoyl-L-alanine amidase